MTKYKKLADEITTTIISGKYKDVSMLPTEEIMIKEYGVSRTTLRSAIDLLVQKGYLYRVQGSGVYIRKQDYKDMLSLNSLYGVTQDFSDSEVTSHVISFEKIQADDAQAQKMRCEPGTVLYQFTRLRLIDHVPYSVEESLYNKSYVPYLSPDILQGSIYEYLENDLELKLGFIDRYIVAEALPKKEAELLHLPVSSPALIIDQKVYLESGNLFNYSKVFYNNAVLYSSAKR